MNPDLYTDIHSVIEGLQQDMDSNPLENQHDILRYSYAFQASMFLKWLLDTNRRPQEG